MSDRRWKTEFFFTLRFWAENLVKVGRDPFPHYTGEKGNLRLEGMYLFITCFIFFVISI